MSQPAHVRKESGLSENQDQHTKECGGRPKTRVDESGRGRGGGGGGVCVKDVCGEGLTAAVLIGAVGAVGLFVTLITGRDAGAIAQTFKLLRSTPVVRALGGCRHLAPL